MEHSHKMGGIDKAIGAPKSAFDAQIATGTKVQTGGQPVDIKGEVVGFNGTHYQVKQSNGHTGGFTESALKPV